MRKLLPVLLFVAAGVLAWILIWEDDATEEWDPDDTEIYGEHDEEDPELLGAEGAGPRKQRPDGPAKTPEQLEAERRAREQVLFLRGVVVAAEGGAPILGAKLWTERPREPCPSIPGLSRRRILAASDASPVHPEPGTPAPAFFTTGAGGRFEWKVERDSVFGRYDVFVTARGFVTGVLCQPKLGDEVTVKLLRALKMPVHVTDRHQRPIEEARVRVEPAKGTESLPGHAGSGVTDREGNAEIDGLLPGPVMLTVDHEEFMPATVGPLDPAARQPVHVDLPPALRLSFEIRSDDGSDVKNPVLTWRTDGTPPHEGILLLKVTGSGPEGRPLAEVKSAPVRIPCDHKNVQIALKADGFAAWKPTPEPLPVDGGERGIIVSLIRDTDLAELEITFEDAEGEPVPYRDMRAALQIIPMHEVPRDIGAVTYTSGETLQFKALPAGPYRFVVTSAKTAPLEIDVEVAAGDKNKATARLTPPAKLKIRFVAQERLMVGFRIMRDGQRLKAFREDAGGAGEDGDNPEAVADEDGTVFSGLSPGSCTVEVVSPELMPATATVLLRAGETSELEMEVRKR